MRSPGVVLDHPGVHRGLRRRQVLERHRVIEQLAAQRLVEPLDLPRRGRRARLSQPVGDAVVAADAVEQHLPALAEPVGELLAVVRQHLLRHPEGLQRRREGQAHRPPGRTSHHLRYHAVAGMVVDPGDDLRLGAVGQEDPADDVHLPQLHWRRALPPQVVLPAFAPLPRTHQPVTHQGPIHRHPRRHRIGAQALCLVHQPDRTPPRMLAPQLTHHRLHLRR